MLFVLQCLDRPGAHALRQTVRVPHLEFVARHTGRFRFGGPLLGDDGVVVGSLMVLDLPDRAALEQHLRDDPFFSSGLFQSVQLWRTSQVVPEASPGALRAEIARQQAVAAAAATPH